MFRGLGMFLSRGRGSNKGLRVLQGGLNEILLSFDHKAEASYFLLALCPGLE